MYIHQIQSLHYAGFCPTKKHSMEKMEGQEILNYLYIYIYIYIYGEIVIK